MVTQNWLNSTISLQLFSLETCPSIPLKKKWEATSPLLASSRMCVSSEITRLSSEKVLGTSNLKIRLQCARPSTLFTNKSSKDASYASRKQLSPSVWPKRNARRQNAPMNTKKQKLLTDLKSKRLIKEKTSVMWWVQMIVKTKSQEKWTRKKLKKTEWTNKLDSTNVRDKLFSRKWFLAPQKELRKKKNSLRNKRNLPKSMRKWRKPKPQPLLLLLLRRKKRLQRSLSLQGSLVQTQVLLKLLITHQDHTHLRLVSHLSQHSKDLLSMIMVVTDQLLGSQPPNLLVKQLKKQMDSNLRKTQRVDKSNARMVLLKKRDGPWEARKERPNLENRKRNEHSIFHN